jgi:hypothetical protein
MDQKHKEAFQELRQWCVKHNAEIYIEDDPFPQIYVKIESNRYFSLEGHFDALDQTVSELDSNFEELGHINFMEQEDDNT